MQLIGNVSSFKSDSITEVIIEGESLLLVSADNQFYLVENKCCHFGRALVDADIKGTEIICPQHGISFSMETGAVVNRPYENCDKLRVFRVVQQADSLYRA